MRICGPISRVSTLAIHKHTPIPSFLFPSGFHEERSCTSYFPIVAQKCLREQLKENYLFGFCFQKFLFTRSVWYLTLGLGWDWIAGMWRRKLFIFKQTGMGRDNACSLLTTLPALLFFHISPQPIGQRSFPPCIPSRPTLLNRSWERLRDVPSGERWALRSS